MYIRMVGWQVGCLVAWLADYLIVELTKLTNIWPKFFSAKIATINNYTTLRVEIFAEQIFAVDSPKMGKFRGIYFRDWGIK